MRNTRDQVLDLIKARGQASIAELAQDLGISTVSVRHHLAGLQGDGLVSAAEVRQGVGRPRLIYRLTEAAQERYPAKYMRLSERLLDELKVIMSPQALEDMFARMAEGVVAEYAAQLAGKTLEQKMALLVELLGAEGFMARWNRTGETIRLTEYNCPYLRIGQRHPEVCAIDQALISQVLNANVEKTTCVLSGDEHCAFVITPGEPQTIPISSVLGDT
jgi:predicted ArsR family transcriptional regulator